MKKSLVVILLCLLVCPLCLGQNRQTVEKADIIRTDSSAGDALPLYQGNGRFGACIGSGGLPVQLMHVQHFGRGNHEMDYLLPLMRLYWAGELALPRKYRQQQCLYDGTIRTSFEDATGRVSLTGWFDAVERNLFCLKFDVCTGGRTVVLEIPEQIKTHYGSRFTCKVNFQPQANGWRVSLTTENRQDNSCVLLTDARGEVVNGKLMLKPRSGNYLMVAYGPYGNAQIGKSLSQTREWWQNKWENIAFVEVSDPDVQKLFVRSQAQLLFTCNEDGLGLMPPCGLSGNAWPFPFPHDLSFVLSTCLSEGEIPVAKAWVEYIGKDIEELKVYTTRLFGTPGVFAPWCYPYGGMKGLNENGVPNRAFYEIHNSGHLCRMAYETMLFVDDPLWAVQYALPLIRECAAFYRSMLIKEYDGLWHIFHIPSFGQDENGGSNQKDYLDALYSARYCFETAVKCGLDDDGFYREVLSDGLAFSSLKSARGYYFSCAGRGEADFGNQKHPVQLNEITLLPMEGGISPEARLAYQDRYDITERAAEPFSRGWTCGSFILASARAGDAAGWMRDWHTLVPSDAVDPEYIQFYESSRLHQKAWFTTNSALFVGSVLTCAVNDWEGEIHIGTCNPWERLSFRNIHSKLGVILSGTVGGSICAQAWKDCAVKMDGVQYSLKKGECVTLSARQETIPELSVPSLETVDLGLSVRWAVCNVGAGRPEEAGDALTFDESLSTGYPGFAVPTEKQWDELIRNCKWTFTVLNGVRGYLVSSKKPGFEGRSLFLPSAGCAVGDNACSEGRDAYYWSSSLIEGRTGCAWSLFATSGHVYKIDSRTFLRQHVRLVRPL